MWEYLAVLLLGFWLGVAIFLYISCYWLEEILDLPPPQHHSSASSCSPSASSAHVQLKRLVARVVEEAAALPALARYAAEPHTPSLESSTYEDLLATAILNKVIERYQNENGSGGRSSGIHSASASPTPSERSSPRSLNARDSGERYSRASHVSVHSTGLLSPSPSDSLSFRRDITPPPHEEDDVSDWEEGEAADETVELPRRVPFPEFGKDIIHNGENGRDFDEISGSDLQVVDGSWEENWLFQKKKIKSQSVPVPMLVPNSNTDYRALIGDRDADDTTDLSDNASETEEAEFKSDMKIVLDSKHVIGGKTKVQDDSDFEPDSLTIIGTEDFEKLVEKQYKDNEQAVNAVIDEINDSNLTNTETMNTNTVNKTENNNSSVLVIGIDSGPLNKAEFNFKEEIHRTLLNGNINSNMKVNTNGYIQDNTTENKTLNEASFIGLPENSKYISKTTESNNTLSHHEREREYEETVTVPVQRYADSLRRKHFDNEPQEIPTRDTDYEDQLTPGSVAYRERKKWMNYVEMPNNPYSPEAIQKRLSAKSTSSLFDMITIKVKELDEDKNMVSEGTDEIDGYKTPKQVDKQTKPLARSTESIHRLDRQTSKGSSPKILKDVLAEDVPQYKRYGRDYYIKEAKESSGGRKKNSISDTSSISSMNKSTSLDNFDTEFTSPVSASSSLSDLEACALHQNIVRAVLSPRNASPNFAINPIFEHPDRQNDNADENHATSNHVGRKTNVRQKNRNVCNGGDGNVENEDIVRLRIPKKPEITEDLFETYTNVRRSNTLRSEDLQFRSKRRPGLSYTFGGSLRLSKGFHTDLW